MIPVAALEKQEIANKQCFLDTPTRRKFLQTDVQMDVYDSCPRTYKHNLHGG